jgi:hypothetical protein
MMHKKYIKSCTKVKLIVFLHEGFDHKNKRSSLF